MADSNIDQDYQLYQILQRRHLFEKPIEFLVKVRCKDGRLREIWQPKANIVSSSIGRSLLRIFNKTKVGERGIDMYIGKRRSLSEKMKSNSSTQKETPGNDFSTNCSVASSNSCSWQLLKTNSASKSISNDNKSTRKVKTRASLSRKQLVAAKSKISLKNSRASKNARQAATLALLKKYNRSCNQEQISNSKDFAHSSTKGSKNGSLSKCSQNHSEVTQLEKLQNQDRVNVKVFESENCSANVETSFLESSICRSCVTTGTLPASHASIARNDPGSMGTTRCSKCFCSHSITDPTSDAGCSEPVRSALGRRVSIRQTESAFRLKEVTVRKFSGFVHLVLGSETSNKRILKNSFDPKVFQEINSALRNLTNDDCRVVLISGFGNNFSSGIDLSYLLESEQDRKTAAKNMAEALREFVSLLINFPKPIVAAVGGLATGLGVAILPLCDIVYASDKAFFSCPYTSLAQTPEACSSYTFPNIMGHAMANEMLLRGRKITALEAHQIGLITQVFLPENLMGGVIARVENLAQQSAKAVECTKALMRSQERRTLESVNQNECRMLIERWSSAECQKAIKLFLDN